MPVHIEIADHDFFSKYLTILVVLGLYVKNTSPNQARHNTRRPCIIPG